MMLNFGHLHFDLKEIFGIDYPFIFNHGKAGIQMENNQIDLLHKDADGDTYLHLVVSQHRPDLLAKCLSNVPDNLVKELINAQNNVGQTPLHLAVITGQTDIVQNLMEQNADAAIKNNDCETCFHLATKLGKNSCLKIILCNTLPESLNLCCSSGKTALHLAVETQNLEALNVLLDKGVNVNLKNEKTGETALHYAVKKENEYVIKKLIEFGADVKVETVNGDTPLHFITSADHRNLAAMLLEKGADVYKKNSSGESPLDLADKTLQRFLIRNRKDRKTRRKKGQSDAAGKAEETQSSSSSEQAGASAYLGAEAYTPLGPIVRAMNKIARRDESHKVIATTESGSGSTDGNYGNEDDNRFQPELFTQILDGTTETGFRLAPQSQNNPTSLIASYGNAEPLQATSSDGKIDMTSRIFSYANNQQTDNDTNQQLLQNVSSMLKDVNAQATNGEGLVFGGDSYIDFGSGSLPDLDEQMVRTLSMELTNNVTLQQTSSNTFTFPQTSMNTQQTSPNIMPVQQTSANMLNIPQSSPNVLPFALTTLSTHQTSPNILPLQQMHMNVSLPQTLPNIVLPRPTAVTSVNLQQASPMASTSQQTLAGSISIQPSLLSDFSQTSTAAGAVRRPDIQNDSIDRALQATGIIDAESQSLAKKMPGFLTKIEELAKALGVEPADVLNRVLSLSTNQSVS